MARNPRDQQIQAASAPAQGSSGRGRFDLPNDQTSLTVKNPSADGSPARANTQVREGTVSS